MAKVTQENLVGAVRQALWTPERGPFGGDLCLLSTEAAWDGFENSPTCVTCTSFWPILGHTVPDQTGVAETLSGFLPTLSLRAASVKVWIRMRWRGRCPEG